MERIEKETKKQHNDLEKLIGVLENSISNSEPEKPRVVEVDPLYKKDFVSLTSAISELYHSLLPSTSSHVLCTHRIPDKVDLDKQQKSMDKIFYAITDRFESTKFQRNF